MLCLLSAEVMLCLFLAEWPRREGFQLESFPPQDSSVSVDAGRYTAMAILITRKENEIIIGRAQKGELDLGESQRRAHGRRRTSCCAPTRFEGDKKEEMIKGA